MIALVLTRGKHPEQAALRPCQPVDPAIGTRKTESLSEGTSARFAEPGDCHVPAAMASVRDL